MHTYRWESHVQPPRTPRPPKVALVSDIGNRRLPCSPRRITLVGLLLLFLFVAFGIKTSGYFVCRFVVLVYRAGDRQELSSQGNYRSHYQSQLTKARRLEQGSTSKCVCGDIYHYTNPYHVHMCTTVHPSHIQRSTDVSPSISITYQSPRGIYLISPAEWQTHIRLRGRYDIYDISISYRQQNENEKGLLIYHPTFASHSTM